MAEIRVRLTFYERAGFVAADASAGGNRMLVRLRQSAAQ
jgi:hypothetical protein